MIQNCMYHMQKNYKDTLLHHFGFVGTELDFSAGSLIDYDFGMKDFCYLIMSGTIKQYFLDADGKERILLVLSRGDLFGDITMLQKTSDMVISESMTECRVRRIEKSEFWKLVDSEPELGHALVTMMSTKFRLLLFQLYDQAYFKVDNQLKNLLCRLAIQHGISQDEGVLINLYLTHQDLASMMGSSRSTVQKN